MTNSMQPGTCCHTCGYVIPDPPRLRTGANHPDTAKEAGRLAQGLVTARQRMVLDMLNTCADGLTDDEVDASTGWGHASTTALMNALRRGRLIGWRRVCVEGQEPGFPKRKTRRGRFARINVLAKFLVEGA